MHTETVFDKALGLFKKPDTELKINDKISIIRGKTKLKCGG